MLDFFRKLRHDRYVATLVQRGMQMGTGVYLNDGFFLDPSHCQLITIEDNVVFGPRVSIFTHDASTKKIIGLTKVAPVVIKRNSFIGANCTILAGAVVGENSVLAAGSVLTGRVPENEVWGGNPARLLMTVGEYREKLQKLKDTPAAGMDFIP